MIRRHGLHFCLVVGLLSGNCQGFGPSTNHVDLRQGTTIRAMLEKHDVEAIRKPLLWEILQEKAARPVLDLSTRRQSVKDSNTLPASRTSSTSSWEDGSRWRETQSKLFEFDIHLNSTTVMALCPQLFRLESDFVATTAAWLLDEGFATSCIEAEPRVLSFSPQDLSYGIDFMSTMMMAPAKDACLASPALMLSAVEGGLQERAVQTALQAAGDATSKANQKVVGDAHAAYQALQRNKRKGI